MPPAAPVYPVGRGRARPTPVVAVRSGGFTRVIARSMPGTWDHVRALLVVGHLAVITIAAVPTPEGSLTEGRLRDPQVRDALAPWASLAARLGLAEDQEEGYRWLWDAGHAMVAVRRTVMAPFSPYLRFSGNAQSWKMFGVAPAQHARLEIHGRAAEGDWEPLYVEHQGPNWGWVLLDHSRVRAMRSNFADGVGRGRFHGFAKAVGRRALADRPDLAVIRVQFRGVLVPPPAKLREQGGLTLTKTFWAVEVTRTEGEDR